MPVKLHWHFKVVFDTFETALTEGRRRCMSCGRGGPFAATPVIPVGINWLICLIYSGLLSKRNRQKQKEKICPQKTLLRCQDPKSGHNHYHHKLTPITSFLQPPFVLVFHSSCFPFNTRSSKACFRFSFCLAVLSVISGDHYAAFPSVLGRREFIAVPRTFKLVLLQTLDLQARHWYL